jgi:hydroxyacylglutathione hydrolase
MVFNSLVYFWLNLKKGADVTMTGKQWFKKRIIADDIILLDDNGQSNTYLITGSKRSMLIDTGWGIGDLPGAVGELTSTPVIVVNTHGHPDHGCGNYQFDSAYVSKEDEYLLRGYFDEKIRGWMIKNIGISPFPDGFSADKWISAKPGGIMHLHDGQVFDLGGKTIEVVSMPGHTPGCVTLLDREDRMLFTGDSVLEGDVWMFLDESEPLEVYLSSLKRLDSVSGGFDMLLPGHGRAPISKAIISEFIRGVENILDGRLKGKPHNTPHGEGLLCRFETCGVVYK